MKKGLSGLPFISLLLALVSCNQLYDTETASPSSEGMSADRLRHIDTLLAASIDSGWITGAVGYIARDGKTLYYKAFGSNDPEAGTPMKRDAIFRIASQTKAITSVAVMILFEEGKLLLDDPVSRYVPEFANPSVLAAFNASDSSYTVIPAVREITIRDLLTHTSGIDYPWIGSASMAAIYSKAGIPAGLESRPLVLGDMMKRLGALPLVHQPGERFTYGLNTDLLGYIVEIVSGMRLDRFMYERIFKPLEMKDTYFYLPENKHSRLVNVYTEDAEAKAIKWNDQTSSGLDVNYPLAKGTYFSGGAGLSSTITDYARFLQMLLNGGEYDGKRVLAPRTVELMTCNQIGNLNLGPNKFGLGFEITTEAGQALLGVSEGSYAWGGIWGTTYWADPEKGMVCLLFMQQLPLSHEEIMQKFSVLAYAAVEK